MARPKGSKNKVVEEEKVSLENYLFIDNLPSIEAKVRELLTEKKLNPSVVQEDEAGIVFINGEPCIVIDNSYLPAKEAQLVLQTRRVVREYIKLQNLINNNVTE